MIRECWWCEVRLRWWQGAECSLCAQDDRKGGLVPTWCARGYRKGWRQ